MSTSLRDQALSCTFASKMWKAERLDKSITRSVEVQHHTSQGIGRFSRNLFPGCDSPLRVTLSAIEKVREIHEYYSVPWPPSRAVKIEAYPKHRDATKEAIAKFDVALQNLYTQYPTMVQQGIKNSNGLATPDEYLDREELFDRFSVTITYGQLDDASDWLKSTLLTPEEAQELVEQTKQSQQRLLNGVLDNLKDQLAACFKSARENLAKKQGSSTATSGPKPRFNVAWLINLQQLAEMLPSFNLMDDPTIPQLLVDLQPILKHTPETMKTSEVAQAEASTCLESCIATYSAWLNA